MNECHSTKTDSQTQYKMEPNSNTRNETQLPNRHKLQVQN